VVVGRAGGREDHVVFRAVEGEQPGSLVWDARVVIWSPVDHSIGCVFDERGASAASFPSLLVDHLASSPSLLPHVHCARSVLRC
jgi:hypothetical protein